MEPTTPQMSRSNPENELDRVRQAIPSKLEICQRLSALDAEKKALKKLLRISGAVAPSEVAK